MLIGYACVSTHDQHRHLQLDALQQAGCDPIFHATLSGAKADWPGLKDSVSHLFSAIANWSAAGSVADQQRVSQPHEPGVEKADDPLPCMAMTGLTPRHGLTPGAIHGMS